MSLLPPCWYARDTVDVARDLLGRHLVRGNVVLRITEVEAYLGPHDSAAHTRMGRTPRNAPMWGPGGHAYIYLCYGIHNMLNVVTGNGDGAAVLIRACEVVQGLELVMRRRQAASGPLLVAGPGKVGQALALSTKLSGQALFSPGALELHHGTPVASIRAGARIGIAYATPKDVRARLRFADGESASVTYRGALS